MNIRVVFDLPDLVEVIADGAVYRRGFNPLTAAVGWSAYDANAVGERYTRVEASVAEELERGFQQSGSAPFSHA